MATNRLSVVPREQVRDSQHAPTRIVSRLSVRSAGGRWGRRGFFGGPEVHETKVLEVHRVGVLSCGRGGVGWGRTGLPDAPRFGPTGLVRRTIAPCRVGIEEVESGGDRPGELLGAGYVEQGSRRCWVLGVEFLERASRGTGHFRRAEHVV